MGRNRVSARIKWLAKSLSKWGLVPFVLLTYLFPSALKPQRPGILLWLAVYSFYLVSLEILSRRTKVYETQAFRYVRIQAMMLFGSFLVILTGGASSPFWFIYLWSLFAGVASLRLRAVMWICAEVSALYAISWLLSLDGATFASLIQFSINLAILFLLTAVFAESRIRSRVSEKGSRYYELLERIQENIDSVSGLGPVLRRTLRWAVKLVSAKDGTLMLLEEDNELYFVTQVGKSRIPGNPRRTFKLGEGIAGWVAQNNRPYVCQDTRTDPFFKSVVPGGMPIRSLVCIPISSHGTLLGVINVDSEHANHFSEDDAQLLVTLASRAADAIERERILESLGKISEMTRLGTEDVYQYIADSLHQLIHYPVAIWQVSANDQSTAKIRAHKGLREDYVRDRALSFSRSLIKEAIETRAPIPIDNIIENSRVSAETQMEAQNQRWKSLLIMPLLAGSDNAVGAISIHGNRRYGFTPWETTLVGVFAGQAGMIIQSAERLEAIQQISELGRSLVTIQESPQILQQTLERVAQVALQVLGQISSMCINIALIAIK